jgi:hypothetical protein
VGHFGSGQTFEWTYGQGLVSVQIYNISFFHLPDFEEG